MNSHLNAETRTQFTKSYLNLLRKTGKVPGVVYGKKTGNVSIAVDVKELLQLLKGNTNSIIELDVLDQPKQTVMVHKIQRDPISRTLLHIDFHQIQMNEQIRASVPIEFVGDSSGVANGGILQPLIHDIELQCLPADLPASITVDVSSLEIGDKFIVADLTASPGVEIKTDPGQVVVTILAARKPENTDDEVVVVVSNDEKEKVTIGQG